MKVLIGMTRPDTIASGSFKHVVQVGERFRQEGAEVAYVIGKRGPVTEHLEQCGFKVYQLSYMERNLHPIKDLLSLFELIKVILMFRPAVCSWHTAKIGAIGRIASFLTGRKNYYVPHGIPFFESEFNPGHQKYRRLEKILSYLPSKIIGVCDFDTQQYRNLGVNEKKLLTIENGMPDPGVKMLPKPQDFDTPGVVVFKTAARFEDQKDYDTLAKSVIRLYQKHQNFELHIYGDGQHESRVKQLFADVPSEVVRFNGVVKDFASVLKDADVYVLSSHWEGLPRTIIEAMAVSLPIIATDVGGVCSLVDDGETGYLIPPQDDEKLYQAMCAYLENPELVREHGKESYAKYKFRFTLDRMLNDYVNLYLKSKFSPKTASISDA